LWQMPPGKVKGSGLLTLPRGPSPLSGPPPA
jgi:hypothetical protein